MIQNKTLIFFLKNCNVIKLYFKERLHEVLKHHLHIIVLVFKSTNSYKFYIYKKKINPFLYICCVKAFTKLACKAPGIHKDNDNRSNRTWWSVTVPLTTDLTGSIFGAAIHRFIISDLKSNLL